MDFRRIQGLLVVFFLIFNVYLSYQIYRKLNNNPQIANIESDQDVRQQLADRGIEIQVDLDEERLELPVILSVPNSISSAQISKLIYQDTEIDEGIIKGRFAEPINLNLTADSEERLLKQIQQEFIANKEYFVNGDEYLTYQFIPTSHQLVFYQNIGDSGPILDQTGEIRLFLDADYEVQSYRQTYQGNVSVLLETRTVISKEEALAVLDQRLETHLPTDSTILDMDVGYHRSVILEEQNIYLPAWKIVYEQSDGDVQSELVDGVEQPTTVHSTN